MSALASLVNHPAAGFLAWSLVHFVWQGALLALGMLLFFRWRRPDAATRYAIGVATLAAMLAAPIVTFAYFSARSAPVASAASAVETNVALVVPADPPNQPAPTAEPVAATSSTFATVTRVSVIAAWLVGVTVLSLRLFGAWIGARRLVTYGIRPVTHDIEAIARRVAGRLALDRVVRVVESAVVNVPVMVGWLKPVVLFPASALSGLTIDQVEALIAHELAHVRRNDYLVNLMQSFVETLLFYHPAVWWVSRQVRTEREHCCDDLAVSVCDRVVYVSALTELASMVTSRQVALAATDGSLLRRVRRILTASGDDGSTGAGWLPALMVVLIVGATAATVTLPPRALAKGQSPQPIAAGVPGSVVTAPVTVSDTTLAQTVQEQTLTAAQRRERVTAAAAPRERTDQDASSREIAQKLEARRAELEKALLEIEQARFALEMKKADNEAQVKIETLESTLGQLRSEQERAKKMVEVGTLNPSELKEIEAKIRALDLELRSAAEDRNFRKQDIELRRKEIEQKGQYEKALAEYEEMLLKEKRKEASVQEMPRYKERYQEQLLERTTQITSPTETIRNGDILRIEIGGEPDLPTTYIVSEAGSVRLPLIGSVTVRGLTLRDAPAAIAKQLTDRKLASTTVKVSLFRPQGRE